jgi:acyl-CoA synthetase (AMP-forming)/AMP-acid ligase II
MSSIGQRIRAVVSIAPDADAVEFEGGWHPWRELEAIMDAEDEALVAAGLGAHAPVGILLRNAPTVVGALVGIVATDRCVVTLNPHQGDAKLVADIRETRPPAVIAVAEDWIRPGLRDVLEEIGAIGLALTGERTAPVRLVGERKRPSRELLSQSSPGIAVEMLTSGTTGPAKRVQLSYEAFERTIFAAGAHYRAGKVKSDEPRLRSGVAIVNAPLVHMSGLFRTLLNICEGRRIALLERFSVEPWLELVRRHRPRAVSLVPSALAMVLEADVAPADLAGIQVVTSGSAKLEPEIQRGFERRYGIPVLPSYGATEFAGGVAGWTLPLHREWGERKLGSVGRPQPGREVRAVDPDSGEALAQDRSGLLEIRSTNSDWVRTTDIGRIDADGFLWIEGRADDAILRGGFKISPADVARALVAHPAVREASVVGVSDARLGQVPVAAVELLPGETVTEGELREFARSHLTSYQVPVEILIVDALPRTPSLKVSQPGVRALFEKPE